MSVSGHSQLRFPIGPFQAPEKITAAHIETWIQDIADFPDKVAMLTSTLGAEELNWRYRPGGWKIKQVVHHCADSHMNSLIRFKLALTEEEPEIRPYFEDRWAELPDSQEDDISASLQLLIGLHRKWIQVLETLTSEQLDRVFIHPEHGTRTSLQENIGIYAWHCNHHLMHIQQAIVFRGNFD